METLSTKLGGDQWKSESYYWPMNLECELEYEPNQGMGNLSGKPKLENEIYFRIRKVQDSIWKADDPELEAIVEMYAWSKLRRAGFRTIHMYESVVQIKQFNPIQMLVILKSFNSILRPD
jgi:hypothetical protein